MADRNIYYYRTFLPLIGAEEMRGDENLDVGIINLLTDKMLPVCGQVPSLHSRLVGILKLVVITIVSLMHIS